eukprot:2844716-Rhodomonas_salina.3
MCVGDLLAFHCQPECKLQNRTPGTKCTNFECGEACASDTQPEPLSGSEHSDRPLPEGSDLSLPPGQKTWELQEGRDHDDRDGFGQALGLASAVEAGSLWQSPSAAGFRHSDRRP